MVEVMSVDGIDNFRAVLMFWLIGCEIMVGVGCMIVVRWAVVGITENIDLPGESLDV